jgi:hypothetical protein
MENENENRNTNKNRRGCRGRRDVDWTIWYW